MKLNRILVPVVLVLIGCGGGDSPPTYVEPPDLAYVDRYVPFTIVTRAATIDDDKTQWVLTNADGAIGCSLIDPAASPGVPVSRVLLTFDNQGDLPCTNRSVSVSISAGSVEFTQWDATGAVVNHVVPIGGAVSFAATPSGQTTARCEVSMDLSFAGGQKLHDTFAFNYEYTDTVTTVCLPNGTSVCDCAAWQTCSDGTCETPMCVSHHQACPSDGSIACCEQFAQCYDGLCCVGSGVVCDPNNDACCTSCEPALLGGWACR